MKSINNYLFFNGNCQEVIDFYKTVFNGEVISLMTFADGPMETPPEMEEKIMHATLDVAGNHLMFSDSMGKPHKIGDNIQLSINCESEDEQTALWKALTEGGIIDMPLEDTFWGARFGSVKDKYGINWMLNYNYPDKKK